MSDKKIESLAYRLKDYESLRSLFAELNFEFADEPVNKEHWNRDQMNVVQEAKIIAKKDDYRIYYIQTNTDSLTQWKGIATKIIKENNGLCLICSHNPSGFKWVFSSLSKDFSKSFTETRHVPIDIRPNIGIPQTFVEFLEKIKISKDATASSIASQISGAFDSFAVTIHDELTVNVFEALKSLSEGIILDESNDLTLDEKTLEEIREPIFILLYRIIFILYAEDRGIFPTEQKIYHEKFSFKWLKQEWLLKYENQKKLIEYQVHERLWNFFRLIELGSEDLGYDNKEFFMRSYYGRIFDRNINKKLDKWKIKNEYLLDAISLLTRTHDKDGNYFFFDYSALETRHLGSIYEHLLEYHLTVEGKKIADLPDQQERKSSGSYYTPQFIVDYTVQKSLDPLIEGILKNTNDKFQQIEKILSLNILDPAMGSGHFLIGVVNYLAKKICEIEDGEIIEQHLNERKRDVVRRCVYGVDINPLSVDLAMVSLWLETLSSERPLSFLSAHLKCGNSLIGSQIDILFDKQTTIIESSKGREQFKKTIKDFLMFENLDDDSPNIVKAKIERYQKIQSKGTIYYNVKSLLDCKIAESFGIKIPIIADFKAKIGENSLDFFTDEVWQKIQQLSLEQKFFHWDLEFPDIFYDENGEKISNAGFDCIIGNPPWERLKTQDREFFASRAPKIANSSTSDIRKKMIKKLEKDNPESHKEYIKARKLSEDQANYLRNCNKFPYTAVGDINLYPMFLELSHNLLKKNGMCGLIVKTGILTDSSYQKFFEHLIFTSSVIACHDFTNKQRIFKDVIQNERFSLIFITSGKSDDGTFSLSVLNEKIEDIQERTIEMSKKDLILFNPNTKTCPLFNSKKDYEVSKDLYQKNPILIDETKTPPVNPWKIEYWRMFDMTNDSNLFKQKEWFIQNDFIKNEQQWFEKGNKIFVPLYEAKLFSNYDHRHGSFEGISEKTRFGVKAEPYHPSIKQKSDPHYEVEPRYWISYDEVKNRCKNHNSNDEIFFAFRNVCRTFTDSRTSRGTIIPFSGVGNSAPILLFNIENEYERLKNLLLFSCVFTSFTFDYLVRQKLSGANLNKYILIQIAAPSPEKFDKCKLEYEGITKTATEWCLEKSCEVYPVSNSILKAFNKFKISKTCNWDPQTRIENISFIDAIVAKIYGVSKENYTYIINQFPILQRQEIEKFGKFLSFENSMKFFSSFKII